jgi:photosystem II stability/assembly factor-like uncharacterized protein
MRTRSLWACLLVGCLCLFGWFSTGCSNNECGNDGDCAQGQVCLYGTCADKSKLPQKDAGDSKDGGNKEQVSPDKPAERTPPEKRPETTVDKGPQIPLPDKTDTGKPGIRAEGDTCDPRALGYSVDRCGTGLACAEVGSTSPSSGAPQPYGICVKACKDKNDTSCPSGYKCSETRSSKTTQGTGIFVCAKEVKEGGNCFNTGICGAGLYCARYPNSTLWLCQKDCTSDDKVCSTGFACSSFTSGSSIKVCKPVPKVGENCGSGLDCGKSAICTPSGVQAYPSICQKKCSTASDCGQGESCRPTSTTGGRDGGRVCYKVSSAGNECGSGKACGSGETCIPLTAAYAGCFKVCTSAAQCPSGQACETYSSRSRTRICKPNANPGDVATNLAKCGSGSRAIRVSQNGPGMCLPVCSQGTSTNAALCGSLTPGTLNSVYIGASSVLAIGLQGAVMTSATGASGWERVQPIINSNFRGLSTSADGKVLLFAADGGQLLYSEDSAKTWKVAVADKAATINGTAVSSDGSLRIAVGAKGFVTRSDDSGKTWSKVTVSSKEDLYAVAIGLDSGSATPVVLIVGAKGTVLRSDDGGKTFAAVTVTGLTANVRAVTLVRDSSATGVQALAAGDGGALMSSTDGGKTWTVAKLTTKANLWGVAYNKGIGLAVGAGGQLVRWESGKWTESKVSPVKDLYGVAIDGQKAIVTGTLGSVYSSTDAGKKFSAVSAQLLRCVGITSGGRPSGGACLYLCNPARQGKDCPASMRCGAVRLGSSSINICSPATGVPTGTAKKGDSCSIDVNSKNSRRCEAGLACARFGADYKCVQRCGSFGNKPCEGGDSCVNSPTLRGKYCGKAVNVGETCNPATALFCKAGSRCVMDGKGGFACMAVKSSKEFGKCLGGIHLPCEGSLVCVGLGTPYRNFCSRSCTPGAANTGCTSGWECLRTNSGSGLCVERCPDNAPNHKCKVSGLSCRNAISQTIKHCL